MYLPDSDKESSHSWKISNVLPDENSSQPTRFPSISWWSNGNLSLSPSCSKFALKRAATNNEEEFGSAVVPMIQDDFYANDCLKSVDDQTSACNLIIKLRQVCSKGGFRLTKFTSNSRAVIASVPEEAKEVTS